MKQTTKRKVEVLFRDDGTREMEAFVAAQKFHVTKARTQVSPGSLVIGRYSVLPFYRELELDLASQGARLINSFQEHHWISNFDWYEPLSEFTMRTWFEHEFFEAPEGEYVIKGRTNSRKFSWNTHMFATSKSNALRVASRLVNDSMIGEQDLVYREYVPLKTLEVGLNGLPFTEEYRFFVLGKIPVAAGFYWSCADPAVIKEYAAPCITAWEFVNKVAAIACEYATFYTLDVARTASGEWILVEINDGQMAGLSECNPTALYANLHRELT